jgi:rhodanese-related sulfurtransferase
MTNDAQLDPDWSAVTRFRGIPEVDCRWTANHAESMRLVDVREPDEFTGPLGHVEGSELVPLRQLLATVENWERSTPVILICRSGGRSGRAAVAMEQMGFTRVVSMAGGMIDWNECGLPVG